MDNVKEKIAIASDHAGYQLKEKIKIGQLMKMTLHFDHGGSIEVTAPVKKHNP